MVKRAVFLAILMTLTADAAFAADVRVGTTFSQVQCEYLGLDWREAYQSVLAMGFDVIRLGAYWDRIEKVKGDFDFSELDWQIQKAREMNRQIVLTVGMKAPRWPEYFLPSWLAKDLDLRFGSAVSDRAIIRERVLVFVREVIDRYKDETVIKAWQVENEPLSRAGPKELWIRRDLLQEEIDLVKKLDENSRPVVINAMTYPNSFLRFFSRLVYRKDPVYETIDIAQIPALDVYPAIGQKVVGKNVCFWTIPKKRTQYIRRFVDRATSQHKSLWITELQAEPWEPGELVHKEQKKAVTCGPKDFLVTFNEMRSLGIDTIFLWGVEYWLYRKQRYQDGAWIDTFDQIVSQRLAPVALFDAA